MRFSAPEHFFLLIVVALVGLFMMFALARKKKLLARFGDLPLIMKNAPYISFPRQRTKAFLLILGLTFVAITLARLQFGTHQEKLKREGLDIVIALDVSTSMMARDFKPNRMLRAKQEIRSIIDRLKGDRVGLVAFAGEAFVQCPLTLDYGAAIMLLSVMDDQSVSIKGTSLSSAIETATQAFNKEEKKHKVLLLLTDGEDHEGGVDEMAETARKAGVRIFTVGIGNPVGEPMPILDRNGKQVGFKKNKSGEVVISKLDEATLKEIAIATGGKYYHATAGELELDKIFDEVEKLEKKELEGTLVTRYDDRFQWPLMIAMLFIVGEFFLPERKKPVAI